MSSHAHFNRNSLAAECHNLPTCIALSCQQFYVLNVATEGQIILQSPILLKLAKSVHLYMYGNKHMLLYLIHVFSA